MTTNYQPGREKDDPILVLSSDPTGGWKLPVGATKHSIYADRIDAEGQPGFGSPTNTHTAVAYAEEGLSEPSMTALENRDRPTRSEALMRAEAYRRDYRAQRDLEERILGGFDPNKLCGRHFIALSKAGTCSMCE